MEITIYQRVKSVLEDKSISVNALSKQINVAQATLNPQLRGDRTLAANIVAKILDAFPDVSAEWLMRGVGTMYSNQDADDSSYMVAEEPKHDIINEVMPEHEYHQDDSVWKAKYEELEKRYDQLLSILGGGVRKANVG
nr:MAG TPA: Transcriptional regulator motif, XRE transcription factor.88A [Caudoviricetes sp.]